VNHPTRTIRTTEMGGRMPLSGVKKSSVLFEPPHICSGFFANKKGAVKPLFYFGFWVFIEFWVLSFGFWVMSFY